MLDTIQDDAAWATPPLLDDGDLAPGSALFDGPRHEDRFGGASGLRQGPRFEAAELARLRALIKERLVYAAAAFSREAADAVEGVDLERYHEVSQQFDHSRMLSKLGRVLSGEAAAEIKQMSFFRFVREVFGDFYLADEDGVGHEQVCIRVVRPDKRDDVGSLHRDSWFWDYYNWPVPAGESRTKVWTGVCVEAERNGLLLAPGSHRKPWGHRPSVEGGRVAFIPEFDWKDIGLKRFGGQAGDPILFNYKTLHMGSVNRADVCRVSIETTIMYRGL